MKRIIISSFVVSLFLVLNSSCGNQQTNESNITDEEETPTATTEIKDEQEDQIEEGSGQKTIKGRVLFKVNGQTFEGTEFSLDPSTPRSEWFTNQSESIEIPTFGASMIATKPNNIMIVIGYSNEKVNEKMLSGTYSLDSNKENPFTIGLNMDNNMKNFTFSSGTVEINKLTPELVKLTAIGTGLYSDIQKQEYLENEKATIELELAFPNIIIDGKDIKRVEL